MNSEDLTLAGLEGHASISIDSWGIPHIRASNKRDLFFMQGFNAARDRLWQIDLWRKRGLGQLSADFGPGYLEQDRAARLFLFRGNMEDEWGSYCDDAREIATAFVAGVNCYVDRVNAGEADLPPEFTLFGTRPARWEPADVVRIRSHSMMRNALSEVIRANVMARTSAGIDELRQALTPAKQPMLADGILLDDIPLEVTDIFKLAIAPVTFEDQRLAAPLAEASLWRRVSGTGDVVRDSSSQGSNNWVIHGDRTETGRPILASDPHRTHAVPSLRYLVHLTCPEFDVIGAGEPSMPGVCIGHNGMGAFGLTLFYGQDQEDVYVYETSPVDPGLYRYGDGWERFRAFDEQVALKAGESTTISLRFSRHGPVVHVDSAKRLAFAIRSVWFEPGTAPYFASIQTMRAGTFAGFRSALAGWGVPSTNHVYADKGGTIGWAVAGLSPRRPNWDGLLPVPGDGRFEWNGFFPAERLPSATNPERGFLHTANEPNLPADWDHVADQIGYEWLERSRADRIAEVLAGSSMHTVQSSGALQADSTSLVARRLTALLDGIANLPANLIEPRRLLSGWSHRLDVDSAAAALFEVWWSRFLRPQLFQLVTDDAVVRDLLQPGDPASILDLLERPDDRLGNDAISKRNLLLANSLDAAFADCRRLLGPDPSAWRWGALHEAHFVHATSTVRRGVHPDSDVGPFEMPGSDSSPLNAYYRPSDFRVTLGASVRVVIDVGEWDNSICINAPGQSGNPSSPYYANLADRWSRGDFVPLLYSRSRVEDATVQRIQCSPAGRPSADAAGLERQPNED